MRCSNCNSILPEDPDRCPFCGYDPLWLPLGTLLDNGKYRVEEVIGSGGFGITYRATEVLLNRRVAIKELFLRDISRRSGNSGSVRARTGSEETFRESRDRFVREGQTLATVNHANVVRVLSLFLQNDTAYLVMDFLEGEPLRALLEREAYSRGGLAFEQARRIGGDLVAALKEAHRAGILHLDIKPANIIICPDEKAVLIDFGAARQVGSLHTSKPIGTFGYAPPEVLAGLEVGPESDVYELAVTLFEMVTGTPGRQCSAATLQEPWKSLVGSAFQIDRNARPKDIEDWWHSAPWPRPPVSPASTSAISILARGEKPAPPSIQPRYPISAAASLGIAIIAAGVLGLYTVSNRVSKPISKPSPRGAVAKIARPTPRHPATPSPIASSVVKPAVSPSAISPPPKKAAPGSQSNVKKSASRPEISRRASRPVKQETPRPVARLRSDKQISRSPDKREASAERRNTVTGSQNKSTPHDVPAKPAPDNSGVGSMGNSGL